MPLEVNGSATASAASEVDAFDIGAWVERMKRECLLLKLDAEGVMTFVGESVRHILDFEPEELVGRLYQDFFDLDERLRANYPELVLGFDRLQGHRCVAQKRDGARCFLVVRSREIVDSAGVLIARELLAQDATEATNAELALRESERGFRRLVEELAGDYIIYTHDPEGVLTYVSPTTTRILGYDPKDVIGQNWRSYSGPESFGRSDADKVLAEIEAGKRFHRFVIETAHADGSTRMLEAQQHPIFDANGRLISVEGICKDITEQLRTAEKIRELQGDLERRVALRTEELSRMNQELRTSEARYRDVVETQTEFITRWLPGGIRTFVNDAYCRYFGVPHNELVGKSFLAKIHIDDRRIFDNAVASLTPENPSVTYEQRVYRADGSIGWIEWTDHAFFDFNGNATEYQSVGRDVTQLKAADDLLRKKEAHLAHVSRLATLGEMVAGIAHEVHQPLHAAKTFAEAARRQLESARAGSTEEAIECMQEISAAVTRTVEIIRRLRDFTKPRDAEFEMLDLNDVVHEAVGLMAQEFRRTGVDLRLNLLKESPLIRGDRIQLWQLCVNMFVNACEAMSETPAGKRRLTVTTLIDADYLCIEFEDSGCGLGEVDVSRLFDAFYTTKKEGMGMGLSMCQSIAEAHGGAVCVEPNAPTGGAMFCVGFPLGKNVDSVRPHSPTLS